MTEVFGLPKKCVEDIRTVLAAVPSVERVVIFGSRAMGNYKPGSDVDLALFGDVSYDDLLKIKSRLDDIPWAYMYDVVVYDKISNPAVQAHIDDLGINFFEKRKRDMNSEIYKIGNAAEVFTGYPFDGGKYEESGGTRVVRGENVTIGELRWDTVKYWNEPFSEFKKYELQEGDIVIGMDGSRVGKNRAQIRKTDLPLLLAQRVARLRAKEGFCQDYIAHVIKSDLFESYVEAIKTGTSIPHISGQQIKEFEFPAPDFKTQRRIAALLTALDDKIELNRRMNETLEGLAQAVWGEWFGGYLGGDELPDGCREGVLSDVLEIKYGKDYKHLETGDIPLYGSGGIMKYVNQAIYENDSILIPRKGTLSNLFYVSKPFWSVDTMFYSKIKNESHGKYLFYLLKELDLASMNVGSAVPSLTTEVLNKLPIVIPSADVLERFEKLTTSFFVKMEANKSQSRTLTALRDALLPRLMGGELEI